MSELPSEFSKKEDIINILFDKKSIFRNRKCKYSIYFRINRKGQLEEYKGADVWSLSTWSRFFIEINKNIEFEKKKKEENNFFKFDWESLIKDIKNL